MYWIHRLPPYLGPELIIGTDSDMSGPNNWNQWTMGTLDINTTVSGKMYIVGDGNGSDKIYNGNIDITPGKNYRVTLKARNPGATGETLDIGTSWNNPSNYISFTPTGVEQEFSGDLIADSFAIRFGVEDNSISGIAFEIDDISLKEIIS
jgi:hypothetical protein